MTKKTIKGLSVIYHKYDVFFIDLWGVVHNGIQLYPGAIEVLENLNRLNKRFVLLSNAPRPSKNVEKFLLNLKMDKIFVKTVFTSGEAALKSLEKNFIILDLKEILIYSKGLKAMRKVWKSLILFYVQDFLKIKRIH